MAPATPTTLPTHASKIPRRTEQSSDLIRLSPKSPLECSLLAAADLLIGKDAVNADDRQCQCHCSCDTQQNQRK